MHQWGWALVDLFFVLSGFVFAQAYLARGGLAGGRGWSAFWVARVARLWPLHLLMLGATALLLPRPENTAAAFAAHLVMAQAFVGPVAASFDGPSWSLSVEAVCYLAFSLAALGGRGPARGAGAGAGRGAVAGV
jgi:peptidoglycan/LPS O-acetylase OafA/YrhL